MNKLYQLRRLSTGEALSEKQPLPVNWGPIFGLSGFIDKIHDLSWLGEAYSDMGWIDTGEYGEPDPEQSSAADLMWDRAKQLLRESDWSMLSDVPMTKGDKAKWVEYRRGLRDIRSQPGFPDNVQWPARPE